MSELKSAHYSVSKDELDYYELEPHEEEDQINRLVLCHLAHIILAQRGVVLKYGDTIHINIHNNKYSMFKKYIYDDTRITPFIESRAEGEIMPPIFKINNLPLTYCGKDNEVYLDVTGQHVEDNIEVYKLDWEYVFKSNVRHSNKEYPIFFGWNHRRIPDLIYKYCARLGQPIKLDRGDWLGQKILKRFKQCLSSNLLPLTLIHSDVYDKWYFRLDIEDKIQYNHDYFSEQYDLIVKIVAAMPDESKCVNFDKYVINRIYQAYIEGEHLSQAWQEEIDAANLSLSTCPHNFNNVLNRIKDYHKVFREQQAQVGKVLSCHISIDISNNINTYIPLF